MAGFDLTTGILLGKNRRDHNAINEWEAHAQKLEREKKSLQARLDTQNGIVEEADELLEKESAHGSILLAVMFLFGRDRGLMPDSNEDGDMALLVKQFLPDVSKEEFIRAMKYGNYIYHSGNTGEYMNEVIRDNEYIQDFFNQYFDK